MSDTSGVCFNPDLPTEENTLATGANIYVVETQLFHFI